MRVFSVAQIGIPIIIWAILGVPSAPLFIGAANAQSSASQMEDERVLLSALPQSPIMQLKPRFNTLSLNRDFGKIDTDTEESRMLPALAYVRIVETRRAPDYGPLWSMVVAVRQNGTPLRTRDGKMIKGWARTDCFVPPDLTEPALEPLPQVSMTPPVPRTG